MGCGWQRWGEYDYDVIPEADVNRVRVWLAERMAEWRPDVHDQIRLELDVDARSVTVVECRPPWREDFGPEWSRQVVARLRYTATRGEWSLYWSDRNSKFHAFPGVRPVRDVRRLLKVIDEDRTGIFWG